MPPLQVEKRNGNGNPQGGFGFHSLSTEMPRRALGLSSVVFNSDLARADWRNQSIEIDLLRQSFCGSRDLHRQGSGMRNESRK